MMSQLHQGLECHREQSWQEGENFVFRTDCLFGAVRRRDMLHTGHLTRKPDFCSMNLNVSKSPELEYMPQNAAKMSRVRRTAQFAMLCCAAAAGAAAAAATFVPLVIASLILAQNFWAVKQNSQQK